MFATAAGWTVEPLYSHHVLSESSDPVILMLTVNSPTQEAVWRQWLPPTSRILVNSKFWRPSQDDETFKLIEHNVTETKWGEASLVTAHEALLREGINLFPNASHFVLVSGDSAPVKTYGAFVAELLEHKESTLMSAYEEDGRNSGYSIRQMLKEAKGAGVALEWWDTVEISNVHVPAAAQWSAIANRAARILLHHDMTAIAKQYEAITRQLRIWGRMVAADEAVVQAILLKPSIGLAPQQIKFEDMSPVWVRTDPSGAHAEWFNYQEVFKHTDLKSNWIFARKIRPLLWYSKSEASEIHERLGLEIILPPRPTEVQVVGIRRKPSAQASFLDLSV